MLPKLICVLIYSLTKCHTLNIYSENFVILAEKYPWRSLMLRKLQYFFERSAPPNKFLRNLRSKYILNIYLAEKQLGIANWPIEGKKTIFHCCVYSEEKVGKEKERNSATETVTLNKF